MWDVQASIRKHWMPLDFFMTWDEDLPKKRPAYELGADLSTLSLEELQHYLTVLDAERQRVEAMVAAKKASQDAANSVFKA